MRASIKKKIARQNVQMMSFVLTKLKIWILGQRLHSTASGWFIYSYFLDIICYKSWNSIRLKLETYSFVILFRAIQQQLFYWPIFFAFFILCCELIFVWAARKSYNSLFKCPIIAFQPVLLKINVWIFSQYCCYYML